MAVLLYHSYHYGPQNEHYNEVPVSTKYTGQLHLAASPSPWILAENFWSNFRNYFAVLPMSEILTEWIYSTNLNIFNAQLVQSLLAWLSIPDHGTFILPTFRIFYKYCLSILSIPLTCWIKIFQADSKANVSMHGHGHPKKSSTKKAKKKKDEPKRWMKISLLEITWEIFFSFSFHIQSFEP